MPECFTDDNCESGLVCIPYLSNCDLSKGGNCMEDGITGFLITIKNGIVMKLDQFVDVIWLHMKIHVMLFSFQMY